MLNEEELVKTENEEVIEEPVEKVEAEVVDSGKGFDVLIEEKRDPLYKSFLKSKKVSNFLTFGVLGMVIAGMILVPNEAIWMKILGWSLLGAGMVAMLLFYFLSKKTFDGKQENIFLLLTQLLIKRLSLMRNLKTSTLLMKRL